VTSSNTPAKRSSTPAHRNDSPYARGSYVQVRMFADRLEIQSPGGLDGNVTVESVDEEQSTRNARQWRMIEDVHIGLGITIPVDIVEHGETPR
jgi:Putative ATP-dependent DNA helicase recG C-terminal